MEESHTLRIGVGAGWGTPPWGAIIMKVENVILRIGILCFCIACGIVIGLGYLAVLGEYYWAAGLFFTIGLAGFAAGIWVARIMRVLVRDVLADRSKIVTRPPSVR